MPLPRKLTPENVAYARGILRRREKLKLELAELPNDDELADELNVSRNCVRRLKVEQTYKGQ